MCVPTHYERESTQTCVCVIIKHVNLTYVLRNASDAYLNSRTTTSDRLSHSSLQEREREAQSSSDSKKERETETEKQREREREREKERGRERGRERERGPILERLKERERDRDRETERERERERERRRVSLMCVISMLICTADNDQTPDSIECVSYHKCNNGRAPPHKKGTCFKITKSRESLCAWI